MFWSIRMDVSVKRYAPRLAAIFLLLLSAVPAGAVADCEAILRQFNLAIDEGREQDAQALVDTIATSADCGRYQTPTQRRMAAHRLSAAQSLMARGRPSADFERLLDAAEATEVLWQASATLAEVRFGERRFQEAARVFDRAIEIVKNETLTPIAPSRFEIESLIMRAAQARLLAANFGRNGSGVYVKAALDQRDGTLGGYYSRSVRGISPQALPIPIIFEYGTTTFTPVGQDAIRELLTVLKEQRPSKVTLVGHTDVRGGTDFNMKLSRDRATAVAEFLRRAGVETSMEVLGKGASEPLSLPEASGLSQDDLYALNRRVEWRRD
jgi:outer membrane protein OmpA-like peptidoglycan-associated protein